MYVIITEATATKGVGTEGEKSCVSPGGTYESLGNFILTINYNIFCTFKYIIGHIKDILKICLFIFISEYYIFTVLIYGRVPFLFTTSLILKSVISL